MEAVGNRNLESIADYRKIAIVVLCMYVLQHGAFIDIRLGKGAIHRQSNKGSLNASFWYNEYITSNRCFHEVSLCRRLC